MKKILAFAIAALMAVSAVSMASCSGSDSNGASSSKTDTTKAESQSSQSSKNDTADSEKIISDLINSEDFKSQIKDMKEQYKDLMDVDLKAEGSTLVYVFKYVDTLEGEMLSGTKSNLEDSVESAKLVNTYVNIAKALEEQGVKNAVVRVEYRNGDDTIIVSKDYTSSDETLEEETVEYVTTGNADEDLINSMINTASFKKQLESFQDANKETMNIDVYADNNALVYEYTFIKTIESDDLDSKIDTLKESLESDSMASTFKSVVNAVKALGVSDPVVRVVYKNGDGAELASKDYTVD